jgi:oligopeptide/dipeptide ABC transporter ATP-binding protein
VRGLSFSVERGEVYALVGASGSGKSVTSMAIMRLLPPAAVVSGEILFDGKDLLKVPEEEMRLLRGSGISMIFQDPVASLNPTMKVGDQVAEGIMLKGGISKRQATDEAVALFGEMGIPSPREVANSYPHQLSGGMCQRVMIAMAISRSPRLLIADEPTTALDVTVQAQILSLIRSLIAKEGTSLLFITHDLAIVAGMSDRVGIIWHGELWEEAPVDALFNRPIHPYTQTLLRALPDQERDDPFFYLGTVLTERHEGSGCPFVSSCPDRLPICAEEVPPWFQNGLHKVRCWIGKSEVL